MNILNQEVKEQDSIEKGFEQILNELRELNQGYKAINFRIRLS